MRKVIARGYINPKKIICARKEEFRKKKEVYFLFFFINKIKEDSSQCS